MYKLLRGSYKCSYLLTFLQQHLNVQLRGHGVMCSDNGGQYNRSIHREGGSIQMTSRRTPGQSCFVLIDLYF